MMENTTPALVAEEPKKATNPEKLTQEEENTRLLFIGRCVDKNKVFPNLTKFGVSSPMTIQELSNSNLLTLQQIGSKLKKAASEIDPEFSDNSEGLKVSGLPAEEWVGFLKLTIKKKKHESWARERNAERRALKAAIDAAKTPQEQRAEAEKKLAELGTEEEID